MYIATPDGAPVGEEFIDNVKNQLDEAYEKVGSEVEGLESDDSMGNLLAKHFQENIESNEDPALARAAFDALLKEERINTACEDLNQLSARGWNSFADSKGDNMINLKYGYGKIVSELEKIVGSDKIHLQEPVTKINYSGSQVEITTKKGVYNAKCVLVTIPLGVLKENHQSLFEPQLADNKSGAIERLGYGLVNKFFIVFERNVFEDNSQGLQILWKEGIDIELQSVKKHRITTEFYKTFNSYEVAPTMKNVLYTFLYGENALFSEKLSDQALIDLFTEILAKGFPQIKLPRIKQLVRSKWGTNPYARGAYAHIKLGSSAQDVEALLEPIDNKVFFAGEGTSVDFISTVHGAYATGKREAALIISALQNGPTEEAAEAEVPEGEPEQAEEQQEEEGGNEEEGNEEEGDEE